MGCALVVAIVLPGLHRAASSKVGEVHTVTIDAMKFTPASLRLRVGDRVAFKNADLVPHTATSKTAKSFDSGMIKPGEAWTVTPPAGANIRYSCAYHPVMEGELVFEQP